MQFKISACKFESSRERELTQDILISASNPRAALVKAVRLLSKSHALGKWASAEGQLYLTWTRLTENEAKQFAAQQQAR